MMTFSFFVPGVPVGKGRPRVYANKYNGRAHGVTPQKTKDYEAKVKWHFVLAEQVKQKEIHTSEPVKIQLIIEMPIPTSWSKKKREAAKGQPHTSKPDIDNIFKAVADALNGLAYDDDKQICEVSASKNYTNEINGGGGVFVRISEINSEYF